MPMTQTTGYPCWHVDGRHADHRTVSPTTCSLLEQQDKHTDTALRADT
jgi:hypothetical protein